MPSLSMILVGMDFLSGNLLSLSISMLKAKSKPLSPSQPTQPTMRHRDLTQFPHQKNQFLNALDIQVPPPLPKPLYY